jgi:hypothetical protein
MPEFDVAHIQRQGINLIIVPLDSSFRYKTPTDQQAVWRALQTYAASAKLVGTVVPVWDAGNGRMGFLAPHNWHPFFKSLDLAFVATHINRRLVCP